MQYPPKSSCNRYINISSVSVVIEIEFVKVVKEEFLKQKLVHSYKGKIRFI